MFLRRSLLAPLTLFLGCAAQTAGTGDLIGPSDDGSGDGGVKGGLPNGPGNGNGGTSAGADASSGGGGGGSGGGGGGADGGGATTNEAGTTLPPPPVGGPGPSSLPTPAGACPDFKSGTVTFMPKTGGARTATVTISDVAKTKAGPLILYWYATGSSPAEAQRGLPISQVEAAGGIVVAPSDVAGAGTFPWLSQLSEHDDLADEIVACAVQKLTFDHARIHTLGFSAGGLMATHLSYSKSGYLASVATYSGGAPGTLADPSNKFAAMIMTGGTSDNVFGQDFFASSQTWQTTLKGDGHFAMLCNHNGGHSIPTKLVPGVFQFFMDHPFGTNPSPYAGGKIPSGISPPCME